MKRKAGFPFPLLLFSLLFALLLFTACSSSDSDDNPDGDQPPADEDQPADGDADLSDGDENGDEDAATDGDAVSCDPDFDPYENLPDALPFAFTRADEGDALTDAEITAFTEKITGFWKEIDLFTWLVRVSHGMHASTGMPDYMVYWHDVDVRKENGEVTFFHSTRGGAHNIFIPTPKYLAQAIAGYLLSGDETMGYIVEQYSKGIAAACKGMVYDENDPLEYLMARNIVTHDHQYEVDGGRVKNVIASTWYSEYESWNTSRIHYPNNPYWGDIYVTNMRSKDDVPHIYRTAPWLLYVVKYGQDASVVNAAEEALEYIHGFTKDIVDSGYHIRTKDKNGDAYIPTEDLASFVDFEFLDKNAECNAKLSSAILGTWCPQENDCETGDGGRYETGATANHYYNYAIIDNFHLAAVALLLVNHRDEAAYKLLEGLDQRLAKYNAKGDTDEGWLGDLAVLSLQSAIAGLPLTSKEAREIHTRYGQAVDEYLQFDRWDVWDESVADGEFRYDPNRAASGIRMEEIAFPLEYCWSPFRNEANTRLIDCDVVADPDRWGGSE